MLSLRVSITKDDGQYVRWADLSGCLLVQRIEAVAALDARRTRRLSSGLRYPINTAQAIPFDDQLRIRFLSNSRGQGNACDTFRSFISRVSIHGDGIECATLQPP